MKNISSFNEILRKLLAILEPKPLILLIQDILYYLSI